MLSLVAHKLDWTRCTLDYAGGWVTKSISTGTFPEIRRIFFDFIYIVLKWDHSYQIA